MHEHLDLLATAKFLLLLSERMEATKERTKARAVALGEMEGAHSALDRLQLVSSPTAVRLAVMDAVQQGPERPLPHPMNMAPVRAWNEIIARDICRRLGWPERAQCSGGEA